MSIILIRKIIKFDSYEQYKKFKKFKRFKNLYNFILIANFIFRCIRKFCSMLLKCFLAFGNFVQSFGDFCENYLWINNHYTKSQLMNIIENRLTPREFEIFVSDLFRAKGYRTTITTNGNDYGRDVIVHSKKGDIFIECKHYKKDNMIGREIVQKLVGSMCMFKAHRGIIISTGTFHKNAREAAKMVGNVKLWDNHDLSMILDEIHPKKLNRIVNKFIKMSNCEC